jgi:hypothetical protein
MVPRLSIMLCFVVLAVTLFALTGQDTGMASLFAGALLPIVILTMLIERVYITTSEEGTREALLRAFWSVLVASAIHPIFRSAHAEYLMFSFPELVIVVMGMLAGSAATWAIACRPDPLPRAGRRRDPGRQRAMIGALRRRGVLGINRRNADYTLAWNQRRLYPLVDDKLTTKRLCQQAGIPVPKLLAVAQTHHDSRRLLDKLEGVPAFVLKPARGAMGNGILVLDQRDGKLWRGTRPYSREAFEYHAAGIISGLYSLAGHSDAAMVEEKLETHPALAPLRNDGVPDIRVIVYRGVPVMCMMRMPTRLSDGRANLHQARWASSTW